MEKPLQEEKPVRIEESWYEVLRDEFEKPDFGYLKQFLIKERQAGYVIYPPGSRIFAAFDYTPFQQVKCVIVGQDPYHGPRQANGLCFSVSDGQKKPPSLINIFKELQNDLGFPIPYSGNLEKWAREGVLLLNTILTVRAGQPKSHHGHGWEEFTHAAIQALNDQREHLVFILWGREAQAKEEIIDQSRHLVLKSHHPSPYSAEKGFFGNHHFSRTNEWLQEHGIEPIDWDLSDGGSNS
ncbi:MAG: uracil-DNA glycosylase [Bacteroidetes bacterium]|nr:uracil-DNA glycosylase [Bacteroidota bacterium]